MSVDECPNCGCRYCECDEYSDLSDDYKIPEITSIEQYEAFKRELEAWQRSLEGQKYKSNSIRSGHSNLKSHDEGIGAVWSVADAEYARRSIMRDRYDETFRLLKRRFDDQTSFDQRVNRHLEPLEITYKEDLVVDAGLTRIAELLTGESTTSFTHFASGTDNTAEASGDTALGTELARVSMVTSGDRFATGTNAKFAGFFDSSTSSGTIAEGGVFDAGSNGTMLFRTVYGSTITHTSGTTVYTLVQTVAQSAS